MAFLLVVFAGLSTGIGAGVVYSERLIVLASRAVLGAALGLSAGVMIYVSFVEIFSKSIQAFEENYAFNTAYLYATLCFFGGILVMKGINFIVHKLDHSHIHHTELDMDMVSQMKTGEKSESRNDLLSSDDECEKTDDEADNNNSKFDIETQARNRSSSSSSKGIDDENFQIGGLGDGVELSPFDRQEMEINREIMLEEKKAQTDEKLEKMGLMTAVAIALHNFPEGLATFVAALDNPSVGLALAIAIAIHNIPEGLCVSIPVYFSSGNRSKAFWWGFISGLSEIVGAGLGWIILKDQFNENVYGILFGLVAGMMVAICIYELLPTAHRYDPQDHYVSNFAVLGMMIMAISLIAFMY